MPVALLKHLPHDHTLQASENVEVGPLSNGEENKNPMSVYGSSSVSTQDMGSQDAFLVVERLKIFSDGSLGAETAAIRVLDSTNSNPDVNAATTNTDNVCVYCDVCQ